MVNDLKHQEIIVAFNDTHIVRYPSFWLRDHCRCSKCSHIHTKQRQINTFELDQSIQAQDADAKVEGLEVIWTGGHRSLYQWDWLSKHTPFTASPTNQHVRSDWKHSPFQQSVDHCPTFDKVMSDDTALLTFVNNIRIHGFSFVPGTPATPEATEQLLNRIAFIRPTQYGAFWDFTSEIKPVDTAYTNLSLGLHTDTTYFTDPAGLQLFHCLKIATHGGGQSTFSDAFAAAKQLYKINPDYYTILSSVRIASHASGSSEHFGSFQNTTAHAGGFPVFSHSVPHIRPHPDNLTLVRWNNDDRHSSTQWPSHERMVMWYRAAKVWTELIASPEYQWETQLEPGMPVIFDNWRILHGRKAFEGQRRICGGYIGMDEFVSRYRMLNGEISVAPDEVKEEEKRNEEKIKHEQEQEEKEREDGENIEPDVVPQQDEGVDRPIAS